MKLICVCEILIFKFYEKVLVEVVCVIVSFKRRVFYMVSFIDNISLENIKI